MKLQIEYTTPYGVYNSPVYTPEGFQKFYDDIINDIAICEYNGGRVELPLADTIEVVNVEKSYRSKTVNHKNKLILFGRGLSQLQLKVTQTADQ